MRDFRFFSSWIRLLPFVSAAALSVFTLGAAADSTANNSRAARLTYLQGTVTVDSADNTESQPAQMNLPLLAGVRLATGQDGQAEVEFEDGSLVRLTPNSALSIDTLTVEPASGIFTTGLSLLHGLAYLELRATTQYRYTLDAGGDVLSPVENTTVRVNFDEPPATFAVLDGAASVARQTGPNASGYQREVRAGETLRGEANDPNRYSLVPEIAEDTWDTWNQDRDQAAIAAAANRTAARDNFAGAQGYGWSDLDANGSWYDVPGQGEVWQPAVAADDATFDPYANGAWVYSGGGYLWASSYGWGWTPYRCGNWSYFNGFGWGWSPVAGCGGYGWGFYGGGRPVNILYPPNGYRVPVVPKPRPGPVHPILPTKLAAASVPADGAAGVAGFRPGARRIGGVTVKPLEPTGSGYTSRGGALVASSLSRDFPVSAATHTAITGMPSSQPGPLHTETGWRSSGVPPASAYSGRAAQVSPVYRAPNSVAPAVRSYPQPAQRPAYTPQPAPRSAPPPAPHPAPAPAAHPGPR
jgi:hypothetical protein